MKVVNIGIYFFMLTSLLGCATARNPDPLEAINRKTFAFNEKLDEVILKPVAESYQENIPDSIKNSVTNFYSNPRDMLSALSSFMQGRQIDGVSDLMRFATNTTIGVLGLFDVATSLGFEKHNEDIGQALGYWGVGPGAYIVWPIFGGSSLRDTTTLVSELAVTPQVLVYDTTPYYILSGIQMINTRSQLLPTTEIIDAGSLDKYLTVRDAYLSYRESLVRNGSVPIDNEFD